MGGLERLDRALPPLFAVAGTVAVILIFLALFGDDGEPSTADPGTDGTTFVTDGTTAPTSPGTPAPSSATPAPTTPSTPSPTTPAVVKAPVTVLNNSRVSGLAARVSDEIKAAGWTVASIGNHSGQLPTTAIYYPPDLKAAAESLLRAFPKFGGIEEAFSGLRQDRLTVILAGDYEE